MPGTRASYEVLPFLLAQVARSMAVEVVEGLMGGGGGVTNQCQKEVV